MSDLTRRDVVRTGLFAALALSLPAVSWAMEPGQTLEPRYAVTEREGVLVIEVWVRNVGDIVLEFMVAEHSKLAGRANAWVDAPAGRVDLVGVPMDAADRRPMTRAGPRMEWRALEAGAEVAVARFEAAVPRGVTSKRHVRVEASLQLRDGRVSFGSDALDIRRQAPRDA